RGLTKARAALNEWCKNVAPSNELRKWYSHDPDRFEDFGRRYRAELKDPRRADALAHLSELAAAGQLTLLTATRHPEISEAAVLAALLQAGEQRRRTGGPAAGQIQPATPGPPVLDDPAPGTAGPPSTCAGCHRPCRRPFIAVTVSREARRRRARRGQFGSSRRTPRPRSAGQHRRCGRPRRFPLAARGRGQDGIHSVGEPGCKDRPAGHGTARRNRA